MLQKQLTIVYCLTMVALLVLLLLYYGGKGSQGLSLQVCARIRSLPLTTGQSIASASIKRAMAEASDLMVHGGRVSVETRVMDKLSRCCMRC
jgi:hypothetical protein